MTEKTPDVMLFVEDSAMKFNDKIRVSLENNEWTQKHFAGLMHVAPTTVQKWIVGKNHPDVETTLRISKVLNIPIQDLLDDSFEIYPYYIIDYCLPDRFQDGEHTVLDAGLKGEAYLHRFNNKAGCAYSAIYYGNFEVWSHVREKERFMIRDWNEWGYKNIRS